MSPRQSRQTEYYLVVGKRYYDGEVLVESPTLEEIEAFIAEKNGEGDDPLLGGEW